MDENPSRRTTIVVAVTLVVVLVGGALGGLALLVGADETDPPGTPVAVDPAAGTSTASDAGTEPPAVEEPEPRFWSETPVASEQVGRGEVPDLDLAEGLTDYSGDGGEITGPSADLAGVDRRLVCGEPILGAEVRPTGRLVAATSGPEYLEQRQVVSYADADAALAQMAYLRDLLERCPREEGDLAAYGWEAMIWQVLRADTGYDSLTFGQTFDMSLGGQVYQFSRVGRGILVITYAGEFGPDSLAASTPDLVRDTRTWAPRLCALTAAGC